MKTPNAYAYAACGAYAAVFLIYSQSWAFTWDEGYHLLASQLIAAGKRPYLDFCFPQTPLNAYWNAWLMRVLGPGWRAPHIFAALFTLGSVWLSTGFILRRFPVESWRGPAAVATAAAIGLSALVFEFGPLAIYGVCLFLLTAGFRFAVRALDREGPLLAGLTGLCTGTAAGASLLAAPAAPVLLVWLLIYNRAGNRWFKTIAFVLGNLVPFIPVLLLLWLGPRQTWFNLFQYHFFYRALYWPETTHHDIEILTGWLDSGQGLALVVLAVCGLLDIRRSQNSSKAEFYLCAWMAIALALWAARLHPTFTRYFVVTVPFTAMLASVGLYYVASSFVNPEHRLRPVLVLACLFALCLAKSLFEASPERWSLFQRQADKIDQLTPRNALLFADEPIYFLTRRTPPPGYELYYTHKLNLPPAQSALLHILPEAEVKRQVESGMFATAYSCEQDDIEFYGFRALYRQSLNIDDCTIFWDWKK